jgi:ketosteroid isomerase-like protein
VSEVDDFLADVLPRLRAAEIALHDGDASGRHALWSHDDPVTLFGAERNRSGWSELEPTFDWLAGRFSECTSLEYEIVAAGAGGDLAYLATIERITAVAGGREVSYALRATWVFRREAGAWKVVHRHGDPYRPD